MKNKTIASVVDPQGLFSLAKEALRHSYAPYSKFHVGAAVLTQEGRAHAGANVENASYGLSICAERAAIFSAVNAGAKKITGIAIATDTPRIKHPCGACLQVISEFALPETMIYTQRENGAFQGLALNRYLPHAFRLKKNWGER